MSFLRGRSACAVVAALLCFVSVRDAEATKIRSDVPAEVAQGALVIGNTSPGAHIEYERRQLQADGAGRFVFGVGRDERGPLELLVRHPNGAQEILRIEVRPRDWPIERVDGVPEKTVNPPPEIAARIAREQAAVAKARERDDDRSDFAQGFTWPLTGRVSGRFGRQRIYNGTPSSPHSGTDVAAPAGTVLRAPAAGIVTFADPSLYLTGGTVLLDHGRGVSSAFLHLSRIDVEVGQRVEQGDALGAVGATGRATGPHMHWGLNWFDVRLDPESIAPPMP
jgi:murein DD-endopeptidase MepM/ murein hydrolase activator NlpD